MCRVQSIAKKASRALIKMCLEPISLPAPVNHFTAITLFELEVLSVATQHTPPDDPS